MKKYSFFFSSIFFIIETLKWIQDKNMTKSLKCAIWVKDMYAEVIYYARFDTFSYHRNIEHALMLGYETYFCLFV